MTTQFTAIHCGSRYTVHLMEDGTSFIRRGLRCYNTVLLHTGTQWRLEKSEIMALKPVRIYLVPHLSFWLLWSCCRLPELAWSFRPSKYYRHRHQLHNDDSRHPIRCVGARWRHKLWLCAEPPMSTSTSSALEADFSSVYFWEKFYQRMVQDQEQMPRSESSEDSLDEASTNSDNNGFVFEWHDSISLETLAGIIPSGAKCLMVGCGNSLGAAWLHEPLIAEPICGMDPTGTNSEERRGTQSAGLNRSSLVSGTHRWVGRNCAC